MLRFGELDRWRISEAEVGGDGGAKNLNRDCS
jgi:hypothetical protein